MTVYRHRTSTLVYRMDKNIYHILVDNKAKILPCDKTVFCLE